MILTWTLFCSKPLVSCSFNTSSTELRININMKMGLAMQCNIWIFVCFGEIFTNDWNDWWETCALGRRTSWQSASYMHQNQDQAWTDWKWLSREFINSSWSEALMSHVIKMIRLTPRSCLRSFPPWLRRHTDPSGCYTWAPAPCTSVLTIVQLNEKK